MLNIRQPQATHMALPPFFPSFLFVPTIVEIAKASKEHIYFRCWRQTQPTWASVQNCRQTYTPYHVPYRNLSYHTVPYHTVPYHTVPYPIIPYRSMPHHDLPHHTAPYSTVYRTVPSRTVELYRPIRYREPYRTISYRTVEEARNKENVKTSKVHHNSPSTAPLPQNCRARAPLHSAKTNERLPPRLLSTLSGIMRRGLLRRCSQSFPASLWRKKTPIKSQPMDHTLTPAELHRLWSHTNFRLSVPKKHGCREKRV